MRIQLTKPTSTVIELHVLVFIGFQFTYTTIFGFYSAYLFVRTGHFVAPFVAHAFCNHMGFPDINDVILHKNYMRYVLIALYVTGLVLWILVLPVATTPSFYANNLYWKT